MNWFEIIGFLFVSLGIVHAILSFIAKGILESNGYEVSYLITQPFYEIRILKELSKRQPNYRTIFKIHRLISYIYLCAIGTVVLVVIGFTIFQYTHN
jgi:hypothetical protein